MTNGSLEVHHIFGGNQRLPGILVAPQQLKKWPPWTSQKVAERHPRADRSLLETVTRITNQPTNQKEKKSKKKYDKNNKFLIE